jgi:hypothetical protein
MIILAIAVILPVMIINLVERGEFVIANSSVFNTWVGLNDVETADSVNDIAGRELREYLQSGSDLKTRNSIFAARIIQKVSQQGLLDTLSNQLGKQYFRLFDIQTFFTTQIVGGGRQSYSADSTILNAALKLYSYAIYGFILISGAIGLCFLRIRPLGWYHLFSLFIAYNLGLFLLLHVKTRYVIQFLPMLIFFAGITSHWLIHKRRPTEALPGFAFSNLRIGLGLLAGTAMSYVAFYNLIWNQFIW